MTTRTRSQIWKPFLWFASSPVGNNISRIKVWLCYDLLTYILAVGYDDTPLRNSSQSHRQTVSHDYVYEQAQLKAQVTTRFIGSIRVFRRVSIGMYSTVRYLSNRLPSIGPLSTAIKDWVDMHPVLHAFTYISPYLPSCDFRDVSVYSSEHDTVGFASQDPTGMTQWTSFDCCLLEL